MNRMTDGLVTAKPGFLDRLIHAEASSPACRGRDLDKEFSQEFNWGAGIVGTRRCAMKPR